jgi:phosphohistidine phosphatase
MKTLLIFRHAKSSKDDPSLEDHERPLNDRGRRDAHRMGRVLREEDLVPDRIVSSTAVRARATAEAAAKASGFKGKVDLDSELYHASPEEYVEVLSHTPKEDDRVMVVGHNPGLERLVETLTGKRQTLPTAAIARVALPIQDWKQLKTSTKGKLERVWAPKELDD